ncbi:MAG: T9SS type A sorting domain-containing protein [Lewinellaceae bacterium]|nr:T9SS type A sorting domain-containing protein [Lewinella sp.]MCB9282394.1 T9SS type A sorting domain-containing protein [Lewinellaceae bacterium]
MNFRKYRSLWVLLLCCYSAVAFGQPLPAADIPVTVGGVLLKNPWAGGLNCPQPSAVDLNNDGLQDLYIFDRVGDVHLTFINQGTPGHPDFVLAPEYALNFPVIHNWCLLRDYDGDGIQDIFSYSDQAFDAVMVYKGHYQAGKLAFTRFHFQGPADVIYIPGPTQLYVSTIDYPAVDDLDCDGDLDILTFNVAGGIIELYTNRSVEMGYGRDSLIYKLAEGCWGGIYESGLQVEVTLSPVMGECADHFWDPDDTPLQFRHSGSTLVTFDGDGDGDKELMLGDLSFSNLNYLVNGGNCQKAWITDQNALFPNTAQLAEIPLFPAAFYLDVTGDGKRDLLAAPNNKLGSIDQNCFWLYQNTGQDNAPAFSLQQKNWLVDGMIDLGTGARPVFVDVDADGLPDLVAGNYSIYAPFGAKDPRVFYFRNTGTASQPAFTLTNSDFMGMNAFSASSFAFTPCFGDLDGDGDLDALVGEQFGHLFFVENTAGPGQPMAFKPAVYDYKGINVGQASVPQIIDLNRDGLPDLLVGERNGNINYFQNTGTAQNPEFNPDPESAPNNFFLGQVDTRIMGYTTGYSAPWVQEVNGQYRLFTGTEVGRIESYSNIDGNLGGVFTTDTETYGQIAAGERTQVTLADINNDGKLEIAVGNFRGGITIYETDLDGPPVGTVQPHDRPQLVELFPNPTAGDFFLRRLSADPAPLELRIFDGTGRLAEARTVPFPDQTLRIGTADLANGVYWVEVRQGAILQVARVVLLKAD